MNLREYKSKQQENIKPGFPLQGYIWKCRKVEIPQILPEM